MFFTGEYKVTYYNRYGGRLKQYDQAAVCVTAATVEGFAFIAQDNEATSFAIDRRIFNSLDEGNQRWLPKPANKADALKLMEQLQEEFR